MLFNEWFVTFIDEKGLNLDYEFLVEHNGQTHFLDLAFMVELIQKASTQEKRKIKETLVILDFSNRNILHYIEFLANAYVKANY